MHMCNNLSSTYSTKIRTKCQSEDQMQCQKKCCVLTTMSKIKRVGDLQQPYPFEKRKAGVLVRCGDKILLVQSYNKFWGIPKGRVELSDKNVVECAKRELLEEAGIDIALRDSDLHKIVLDNCYIFQVFVDSCDIVNPRRLYHLDCTGIGWVHRECLADFDITFLTRKALEHDRDASLYNPPTSSNALQHPPTQLSNLQHSPIQPSDTTLQYSPPSEECG